MELGARRAVPSSVHMHSMCAYAPCVYGCHTAARNRERLWESCGAGSACTMGDDRWAMGVGSFERS